MKEVSVVDAGGNAITMMELDSGYRAPLFFQSPETIRKIWEQMPDFKCREDDILLCTFPKTGTNWIFEVLSMIRQKKAERIEISKLKTELEAELQENIEAVPSPRVLNAHIHYRLLPADFKAKQIKTVLVMRNPKDTAVSAYNHYSSMKKMNYDGKWENWLPTYMNGGFALGTYASYLLEWEKAIQEGPGFPVHVMYYEDMKENGKREIQRLMEFLGVDVDSKLAADIEDMCQFQKMKETKTPKNINAWKANRGFFRKGEVGDWKNWFTVAQNEMFDKMWNERMKTSTFKFKYVLSAESS